MTEPTIDATRPQHVLLAAVLGCVATWLALGWWQGTGASLPIPGVVTWVSVLLVAAGIGWLARRTGVAVREDRASLPADQAVTRVLLGKASQVGGALLGGAYLGLVLLAVPGLPAPLAVERVVHGAIAALGCAAWAGAGRWLESVCRIPPPDDPDTPGPPAGHEDQTP